MATSGGGQIDAVATDALLDGHPLDCPLHGDQPASVGHGLHVLILTLARHPPGQHVPLLVVRGVAERHAKQEPVELGLRQRVRALVLDRVCRGQHVEGFW